MLTSFETRRSRSRSFRISDLLIFKKFSSFQSKTGIVILLDHEHSCSAKWRNQSLLAASFVTSAVSYRVSIRRRKIQNIFRYRKYCEFQNVIGLEKREFCSFLKYP